jgi:hypothetical protein
MLYTLFASSILDEATFAIGCFGRKKFIFRPAETLGWNAA